MDAAFCQAFSEIFVYENKNGLEVAPLFPLFNHGLIGSDELFLRNCQEVYTNKPKIYKLACELAGARDFKIFSRSASDMVSINLKLRGNNTRIISNDIYSQNFGLPLITEALPVVRHLIKKLYLEKTKENNFLKSLIIFYGTFLTLHPYSDGNGRAARLFFASNFVKNINYNCYAALALVFLHRRKSYFFGMVMKSLRMGDVYPLLYEYFTCCEMSERHFRGMAEDVCDSLLSGNFEGYLSKIERFRCYAGQILTSTF